MGGCWRCFRGLPLRGVSPRSRVRWLLWGPTPVLLLLLPHYGRWTHLDRLVHAHTHAHMGPHRCPRIHLDRCVRTHRGPHRCLGTDMDMRVHIHTHGPTQVPRDTPGHVYTHTHTDAHCRPGCIFQEYSFSGENLQEGLASLKVGTGLLLGVAGGQGREGSDRSTGWWAARPGSPALGFPSPHTHGSHPSLLPPSGPRSA